MKILRKTIVYFLAVLMCVSALEPLALANEGENAEEQSAAASSEIEETVAEPTAVSTQEETLSWQEPGNSDLNILAGGKMLSAGESFYYANEDGIFCDCGGTTTKLSGDRARNLNLTGDCLYYTSLDIYVRRISLSSGSTEEVYSHDGLEQMYVIGSVILFLAEGGVYTYDMTTAALECLETPSAVTGLIPTQFGNIYLTGECFERSLWVNGEELFTGVGSCYTDSGYLVICRNGNWQVSLENLFAGDTTLAEYSLHSDECRDSGLSDNEQMEAEAEYFESELYEQLDALGHQETGTDDGETVLPSEGGSLYITAQQQALSNGNTNAYNIARRARQQAEVLWTAQSNFYGWGGGTYRTDRTVTSEAGVTTNYFKAGQTYQGIPYSQAVNYLSHNEAAYVGWDLSISQFVAYANNASSKLYTSYSVYGQKAPYYGSDCSGFVSWAWNLPCRCTCSSLVYYSTLVGSNINQIQLGDCLNCTSAHVVLVSDIGYDVNGNIVSIEITEQTPLIMKVTNYGLKIPNKANDNIYYNSDLTAVQRYYLNNGYYIYRRNYSTSVGYTADAAVPLTEDGWMTVPIMTVASDDGGTAVTVKLSHKSGAAIRYTLDGSAATLSSAVYTQPLTLTKDTTIRAIADYSGTSYTGAAELVYDLKVDATADPSLVFLDGAYKEPGETDEVSKVSDGCLVTLESDSGATIYYTTDGSEPTTSSNKVTGNGLKIDDPLTIKAFAVCPGKLRSATVSWPLEIGNFHKVDVEIIGCGEVTAEDFFYVIDGGSASYAATPETNYKLSDITVDGKSIGAKSPFSLTNVKADTKVVVTFVIDLPFQDVSAGAWYDDEVAFVYTLGLFNGTSSTKFSPKGKMTRGMFATVLGRAAGQKSVLENFKNYHIGYANGTSINVRSAPSITSSAVNFIYYNGSFLTVYGTTYDSSGNLWYHVKYGSTDGYIKGYYNSKALVNTYSGSFNDIAGRYYNGYVQWAYYNGLISGKSAARFGAEDYITRQDICVILYNYLTKYCNKSLSAAGAAFTDDSSISSYAKTAVYALSEIGIVNGYNDGSFRPKKEASRAEVAAIFMRLYDYLNP